MNIASEITIYEVRFNSATVTGEYKLSTTIDFNKSELVCETGY